MLISKSGLQNIMAFKIDSFLLCVGCSNDVEVMCMCIFSKKNGFKSASKSRTIVNIAWVYGNVS